MIKTLDMLEEARNRCIRESQYQARSDDARVLSRGEATWRAAQETVEKLLCGKRRESDRTRDSVSSGTTQEDEVA